VLDQLTSDGIPYRRIAGVNPNGSLQVHYSNECSLKDNGGDWYKAKAYATGASKVYVRDLREEFLTGYVWPALKAGAVYEKSYPMATA